MGEERNEGDDVARQELAGQVAQRILRAEDRQVIGDYLEARKASDAGSPETPEAAYLSRDPSMFRRALEAFARLRAITNKVLRSGRDM